MGGVWKNQMTAALTLKVVVINGIHQNLRKKSKSFLGRNFGVAGAGPFAMGSINWKPEFDGGTGVKSFMLVKTGASVRERK